MKFNIQNVGIIKQASIKFDGLTVIAGENDTGKTTLGKYLYAAILNNSLGIPIDQVKDKSHYNLEYSENEEKIKQIQLME